MKRNFLYILIFLTWTSMGFSQSLDFPDNNAVWKEMHNSFAGPHPRYFAVCGDTTINNAHFSQVVELQVDSILQITSSTFIGGLRQSGPIIYMHYAGEADEIILYDFTLEQGDEITLKLPYGFSPVTRKVELVETQMIEGKIRKVIHFVDEIPSCTYEPEIWIEGIGSSYGLLGRALDPCSVSDLGSQLLCFQYLDEYLNLTMIECFLPVLTGCGIVNPTNENVPSSTSIFVYPNPANEIIYVDFDGESSTGWKASIYSALGQKMTITETIGAARLSFDVSHLASGIYFIEIENERGGKIGISRFVKN